MGKEYKDLDYNQDATNAQFYETLISPTFGQVFEVRDLTDLTCAYTIENINTSVAVRLEGSLDGNNWFNLDVGDTKHTINGTFAFTFAGDNMPPLKNIRFVFVSEEGGNSAEITIRYAGRALN